jgi:hypothetical protein
MDDMLHCPLAHALHIMNKQWVAYEDWKHLYSSNPFFSFVVTTLQNPTIINQIAFLNYFLWDGWLYKVNHLSVSRQLDYLHVIKEARSSTYDEHFGTWKTPSLTMLFLLALHGVNT